MPNMALGFPVKLPCLTERERSKIRLFDKTTENMNGECCGSREEGQANDIPATLVVEYYSVPTCTQYACAYNLTMQVLDLI